GGAVWAWRCGVAGARGEAARGRGAETHPPPGGFILTTPSLASLSAGSAVRRGLDTRGEGFSATRPMEARRGDRVRSRGVDGARRSAGEDDARRGARHLARGAQSTR